MDPLPEALRVARSRGTLRLSGLPTFIAIEQIACAWEFEILFPYLNLHRPAANGDGARRRRDWYCSKIPTVEIPTVEIPANKSGSRKNGNGPLGGKPVGTITTRPPRYLWRVKRGLEADTIGSPSKRRLTLSAGESTVAEFQLQWCKARQRYLLPTDRQLVEMQGYPSDFVDRFLEAHATVSREIDIKVPTVRHIVGNGWSNRHAAEIFASAETEPVVLVELFSGMGPAAWMMAQRFGGRLTKLRLLIQCERDPALRRLTAEIFKALKRDGVLPVTTRLVQRDDVFDMIGESLADFVGEVSSVSPADIAVVAGPPCNGFAGNNRAPGINGKRRLNHPASFAAVAVALVLFRYHLSHTAGLPSSVYNSVARRQDTLYIDSVITVCRYALNHAVDRTNWLHTEDGEYATEVAKRHCILRVVEKLRDTL